MSKKHVPSMSNRNQSGGGTDAREKRVRVIVTAVIALAFLCALVIPKLVQRQKNRLVGTDSQGVVKGIQDNWLVANLGEGTNRQYSHIADIEPAEGYTLKGTGYLTDPNVRTVYFVSDTGIPEYTVTAAHGRYDQMAADFRDNQEILFTEVLGLGEVETGQAGQWHTAAFWVNGTIDDMFDEDGNAIEPTYDAEGNAVYPQKFEQAAYCYVESPVAGTSVLLSVTQFNRKENAFMDPSEILAFLTRAAQYIRYQ